MQCLEEEQASPRRPHRPLARAQRAMPATLPGSPAADMVALGSAAHALVRDAVAPVGDLISLVGDPVSLVRDPLTLVGDPLAFVGGLVAPIRGIRLLPGSRGACGRSLARGDLAPSSCARSLAPGLVSGRRGISALGSLDSTAQSGFSTLQAGLRALKRGRRYVGARQRCPGLVRLATSALVG